MRDQTEILDGDEIFAALMARLVAVSQRSVYGLKYRHALKKISDEAEKLCRRPRNVYGFDMVKPDVSLKKRAPRMVRVTLTPLHPGDQEIAA